MTDFPSDAELDDAAKRVADKLYQMMTECHAWSQPPEYGPDATHHPHVSESEGFRGAVYRHSESFKVLDPAKIEAEYNRMWHQMSYIEFFMLQQERHIAEAMQRVGALYGMAVLSRRSYLDLSEATIAACEHELEEQAKRDATALVSLGMDVVAFGVGMFTGESETKAIMNVALTSFADAFKDSASYVIAGSDARDVLNNYTKASDDMGRASRRRWSSCGRSSTNRRRGWRRTRLPCWSRWIR